MADADNPYITLRQVQQAEDARKNAPNALVAGLKSGAAEAAGLVGSGIGLVGKLVGSQGIEDFGRISSAGANAQAAQYGRPDLENLGDQTLGSALPYLGYQAAKMVPLIGGIAATSAALP